MEGAAKPSKPFLSLISFLRLRLTYSNFNLGILVTESQGFADHEVNTIPFQTQSVKNSPLCMIYPNVVPLPTSIWTTVPLL